MRPALLTPLFADTTQLKGVGPKVAALIDKVAGRRIVDLILTPPSGLIDRSHRPQILEARPGTLVTLNILVDHHEPSPNRRRPYRVICSDETGFLTLVFFHARPDYLQRALPQGAKRLISGKLEEFQGSLQMTHPDHIVDPDEADGLPLFEPVYPLTAGLSGAVMGRAMVQAKKLVPELPEWQEASWLKKQGYPPWHESIAALHAPQSDQDLSTNTLTRMRLAYDELLANQLALCLTRRKRTKSAGFSLKGDKTLRAKALNALPYALTGDQRNALEEIFEDMATPTRMVRLLQGDVGAGKTVVALMAMLCAIEAGHQAVLMAPTEILARQHLEGLAPLCDTLGVRMDILTGRDKGAKRREKLAAIQEGETQILTGTHAVFQDDVNFANLGLVIVDEQHRFGVHQRMALTEKGTAPDLLVMTATPIPRTLALTAYGDMDVSVIREKPPGRKPVTTRIIPLERLEDITAAIERVINKNEQAYWVCPLVDDSDIMPLTAVETRFTQLQERFGDKIGLVHGRMSADEKDHVMEAFHRGDVAVLVATTVIEVGVNAPNATVMVIEHAERFGLAQLHQLRGRVGRGEKPAACLLLYKGPLGETAKARLQVLRESEDGFRLAEEDLRLRGAGDLLGTAQSGFPQFRLADAIVHGDLLAAARDDAKLILETDPDLETDRGKALKILLYLFGRDDAVRLLRAG